MENVSGEQRDNARPVGNRSSEDAEPVTSTTAENDNNLERNNNRSSGRCLEPAARMILPPRQMVNPFSRPRDFDALKSEDARLESFTQPPGWPIPFIRPKDCARAGFFFLQDDDKVQCAFCKGVLGEWEQEDDPIAEHRRHFPLCPYILGLPVGNVPLGPEELFNSQDEAAGVDVCGRFAHDLSQLTLASDQPASVRGAQPLGGNGNEVVTSLGIKTCGNGPAHSNLVTAYARIKTFVNWPKESGQTPEIMAEAGFFYIGRRDHVKCFYCDGGLRSWEASDDPWFEHARWFSNCTYVILNKGDNFVKEVNKTSPSVASHQDLNKYPALSLPNTNGAPNSEGNPTRRVLDQELRELLGTPIVQAALEMGMELAKVEGAIRRIIQQTGQQLLTTEALLEAVLERDSEHESDSDSATDENEDENLSHARRQNPCHKLNNTFNSLNMASHTGGEPGSSAEVTSSSSLENSRGSFDEEAAVHSSTSSRSPKHEGTATCSESSTESLSTEGGITGEEDKPSGGAGSAFIEKDTSGESDLEEEARKLREQILCKICMDSQVGIVFLPCGHLVSCTRCATALSNCALCRQPIKAFVRTYLS